jgi:c-di-GMP phosphodiesterase
MIAAVLGGVLAVVVIVAALQLRSAGRRAQALETEQEQLKADINLLKAQLGALQPYRGLVQGASDWVWAADEEGTLTLSNPAGAALLGHEDLIGRSLTELTHADDVAIGFNGVVRRLHADGSQRTMETRSVRTDSGWLGIDRDLTSEPTPVQKVAVVRLPVVDGQREVIGYEVLGDGSVLNAFTPDELLALGAGRPVWLTLDGDVAPELPRERAVIQLNDSTPRERVAELREAGFTLAYDGLEGPSRLLELCSIVKVRAPGRDDEELGALLAKPSEQGLVLVATHVATAEEFTRCRVLGFSHFQGEFFSRPRGEGKASSGALASMQALGELTASDSSFEALERIVGADVGLSIGLLRHVNSAFFALPREISTVREALTLLGTRAVRRWATVVALSSAAEAPDQLIALALLRGRMCELLSGAKDESERERLFTVGLFSVADALLDAPMEDVLASLPLSEEIAGAILRYEGRRGRVLATVLRYEQGHFPDGATDEPAELADAYLAALRWADDAGRWLS